MSYILEALKRSQQERELGRVPTLDTATPALYSERAHGRRNPWVPATLAMAVLALAVALYALLALRPSAVGNTPAPAPSTAAVPPTAEAITAQESEPTQPDPTASPRPAARHAAAPTAPPSAEPAAIVSAPRQALASPASKTGGEFHSVVRPLPASPKDAAPPLFPMPAETAQPLPPDLLGEVEAFQRRVLAEQGETPQAEADPLEPETSPQASVESDTEQATEPTETIPSLRELPPQVQTRIPPQRISVHVYAADPLRRFVILNSKRLREGESTNDGLRVERILPDGVILGYDEHRFFRAR